MSLRHYSPSGGVKVHVVAQVFGSDFAVPSWPALSPFSARGLEESPNSILVVVVGQAAGKGWVGSL